MAVQLKDGGRYPASVAIPADQFQKFAEDCRNPPKPSAEMMAILKVAHQRKVVCR